MGRLASLDGLRGLAALVVVVHHALMTWQVLAAQYQVVNPESGTWWLVFTPLHLVWAGGEAVLVFFVLSGFVLTASALGARARQVPGQWRRYYASRFLRLYVPVWASLALAWALAVAFPRVPLAGSSWWFDLHAGAVAPGTVLGDALLVEGVSWLHPSLWSLRFEVLFSVLLPFYVFLVGRRSVPWWVPAVLSLVVVGVAQRNGSEVVSWLSVFGVGAAMAAGADRLRTVAQRWDAGSWAAPRWTAVLALAAGLLLGEWWVRVAGLPLETWGAVVRPASAAGGGLLVFAALGCGTLRRLLEGRRLQWLGAVSFSLYLVHEPIVVSVASIVGGGRSGAAVTLLVGTGAALLVAAVFHRWVELPSVRLARWAGDLTRPVTPGRSRHGAGTVRPAAAEAVAEDRPRRVLPPVPPSRSRSLPRPVGGSTVAVAVAGTAVGAVAVAPVRETATVAIPVVSV